MMQFKKEAGVRNSIIGFMLILNVVIIVAAVTGNADLYWLLILTIPLLGVVVYFSRQTNRLGNLYYIDSTKAVLPGTHFGHSSNSVYLKDNKEIDLGVQIGNDQCRQPFKGSVLNLRLLNNRHANNSGIEKAETYKLAGDGSVLQVGPDCFSCRTENGNFDRNAFKLISSNPEVKLIELVLPSSMKFRHEGDSILQTSEIFKESNLFFSGAEGMIHFLDSLRTMSGGKSIGIRLSVESKKDFYRMCHAMQKTQFFPDFIVVEGAVKGRNDFRFEPEFLTRLPLFEALQFVSGTLKHYSLEKKVKIVAAGNIYSGSDILKTLAIGANVISCEIPDHYISRYFPKDFLLNKNQIINDIYKSLMRNTTDMMKAYGFRYVKDITIPNLFCKLNIVNLKSIEPINGSILDSGSVKKIYNTKMNAHKIPSNRSKQSIA